MTRSTNKIDRPELVRPYRRPWFRTRNHCLSPVDWQAFGDALAEACPGAVYARDLTAREEVRAAPPPELMGYSHLMHCQGPDQKLAAEIWMSLDPDWQPSVYRNDDIGRWSTRGVKFWPQIRFLQGFGVRGPDGKGPEYLPQGEIHISCEPENKEHVAFARQFFGLLGKFATNRNQARIRFPAYEVSEILEKGSDIWIGHDAIRWAREDPKRLLAYGIVKPEEGYLGSGLRPADPI